MRRVGWGSALVLVLHGAAWAQTDTVIDDAKGTVSVVVENDGYFGTDDNYTSGLRFGYLSGQKALDGKGEFLARRILGFGQHRDLRMRRGYAIAQQFYTPEDLQEPAPIPDDQPYAAYLYGEFTTMIEQARRVDQLSVQLGVVGQSALGEEAQDFVHSITGREQARGWDNQIDDTPGINISWDNQFRMADSGYGNGLGWDLIRNIGVTAGTVETSARIGAIWRLGKNLTPGYGPPGVRPNLAGSGFFVPQPGLTWYLFTGVQGKAVAHNIFLDGSLFRDDDPSVDREALVGEFQAGAAFQLFETQIAFTYVIRSEEFSALDSPQAFGAFSVAKRF